MESKTFKYSQNFELESGVKLPSLEIGYTTFGALNEDKSNVVWVFHALTANQNPLEWWPGLFGNEDFFNPNEYFIVCANVLGGCYGSTGPASQHLPVDFQNGYFPLITIRDIVKAHQILQNHLEIEKVHIAIGGSFGGYQAIEFAKNNQQLSNLILIATAAVETPWNIAIHETQRQAIRTDANFDASNDKAFKGLETARGIGMLTYRTPDSFRIQQPRSKNQITDFKSSSYVRYQGEKLAKRFSPWTYYKLTETLDTHDLSRGEEDMESALQKIHAKTLLVGITEDILAASEEMKLIENLIPHAEYVEISSRFGHDGFLLETEILTQIIKQFLN